MGRVRSIHRHEAGHMVVSVSAFGWHPVGVTTAGGTESLGCSQARPRAIPGAVFEEAFTERPFICWSPEARRHLEERVVVTMAGELAALMLAPKPGRYALPIRERAMVAVGEMPVVSAEDPVAAEVVTELRAELDRPGDSDTEKVFKYCWTAHGSDYASGGTWLQYLEASCRAVIKQESERIELLAAVLAERSTLTGDNVLSLLDLPAAKAG
jgi:hypothetical protein